MVFVKWSGSEDKMIHHNGYYKIGDEIINNKFYALIKGSKMNIDPEWWFYDEVYDKACDNFRSYDISLKEIYRQRAQQLRDKYDYLILNYSGGSDSHNVLCTFLEFNIKLDMVYIQWPMSLMDKGLYTPNVHDTSNFNYHSEWDFVLKKDLEWLSKKYPEIKIEIGDWVENVKESYYDDDLLLNNVTNLPSISRAQKQNTFSKTETKLSNMGLKVGSVYGVDKPVFGMKNNKAYFKLPDSTCMAQPNPDNPNGLEYFYFTPDMPEILIVQAYNLFEYHKKSNDKSFVRGFVFNHKDFGWYSDFHDRAETHKLVCYPYWTFDRFQADKPWVYTTLGNLPMGVRSWDNILYKGLTNFSRVQKKWEYIWKSYMPLIDERFFFPNIKDTISPIFTKWHQIKFN